MSRSIGKKAIVMRYAAFAFGFAELLFYGGLIYGWANLVFVLKSDGYFSHLCQNETDNSTLSENTIIHPTCTKQDVLFNLVFTVGAFSVQGCVLFNGVMFDYFGTRFTRVFLHVILFVGLVLMSCSSPSMPFLIFPGMLCISIGGIQLLLTNIQIGNLFGRHRATVMTAFTGCIGSSGSVLLLIKIGHESGISLRSSFALLAGASLFFLINTLILLPKRHIPWPLPVDWNKTIKLDSNGIKKSDIEVLNGDKVKEEEEDRVMASRQSAETKRNEDFPSLKSCVCSPLFFLLLFWFSVLQLRLLYFLGTLNSFLNQITDGNEIQVSYYSTNFGFYQICGILVAPFSGIILDRNKGKKGNIRGPYEDLRDSRLAFALTTLFYIAFSIFNAIPVLELLHVTFALHIITRGFMYAMLAAGIIIFCPIKFFGSLYGLLACISGIIGLLQFPIFIVSQEFFNDDPLTLNILLLLACVFTIVLPIYIHVYVRRKTKEPQVQITDDTKGIDNPVSEQC